MDPGALQAVALAVAAERSLDAVLHRIVDGLARQHAVALARVWLLKSGDVCETCRLRAQCPDQAQCLHLVASAGTPHASATIRAPHGLTATHQDQDLLASSGARLRQARLVNGVHANQRKDKA